MTLMSRGLAWHKEKLDDAAGLTVTYQRGSQTVEVTAVRIFVSTKAIDETGVSIRITEWDWLIDTDALSFDEGNTLAEPRRGDLIIAVDGTETVTYEALPKADDAVWHWLDRDRNKRRIHTEELKVRRG